MHLLRVQSGIKPRDSFAAFVLRPIEDMTRAVRRGDEVSEQMYADIDNLIRRTGALSDAINARTQMIEED